MNFNTEIEKMYMKPTNLFAKAEDRVFFAEKPAEIILLSQGITTSYPIIMIHTLVTYISEPSLSFQIRVG